MKTIHAGGLLAAMLFGLLFGVCAAPAAFAQKTYRCGSTYQSYPCAGSASGQAGAASKGAAVAAKSTAPATASATVAAPAPMTEAEKKAADAKAAEEAEAKKKVAAVAEKKAKCDKIGNDLNYNSAQQKSGGSKTTMDRLAGERKVIEADMKKEACSPS